MASLSLISSGLLQFVVYFTILGLNRSCISSKHARDIGKYLKKKNSRVIEVLCRDGDIRRSVPFLIDFVHPPPSPFSFTTQCSQKKKFFVMELDIMN
jgi:hypothetical protein